VLGAHVKSHTRGDVIRGPMGLKCNTRVRLGAGGRTR
jgi:hypothetical protein